MATKERKSTVHLIIETLMSGDPLRSKEITDIISDNSGKNVKVQDVASMLSRITDAEKCELGYFIRKKREGNRFTYRIVDEFLNLSPQQAYGMTLKTGKERYPLDQALKDFPVLGKYVVSRPKRKDSAAAPKVPETRKARRAVAGKRNVDLKAARLESNFADGMDTADLRVLGELVEKLKEIVFKGFNININVTFKVDGF